MAEGEGLNPSNNIKHFNEKHPSEGPIVSQGLSNKVPSLTLPDFDAEPAWVAWRDEDGRKVPYSPRTGRKASGPHSTWGGTYKAASALAKRLGGHVGIVLGSALDDYRLLGIDQDGCRDPEFGTITAWARRIIDRFASYWEVSPSGTGVKLFMVCAESDWQRIRDSLDGKHGKTFKAAAGKGEKAPGIELYIGERYFTVTGDRPRKAPETLAIVTADEFMWTAKVAGPEFAEQRKGRADSGHKSGWNDRTESGFGWEIAVEARRDGVSFEEYKDRLEDCEDVSRWREDDRQVERAWANALKKVEDESPNIDFEYLGPKSDRRGPLERMNEAHAVVRNGGKVFIAHFNGGKIDFGPVADLHLLYKNKPLQMNGKTKSVSEHWIDWPKRLQFPNGVEFDPSEKVRKGTLNLWKGWAVRPDPHASCKLFLNHLRHVVCSGDEAAFRYIVGWMADLVQNAGRKPGVGLILKGGKGAGKSIVSDYLAAMIGTRHSPVIAESNQLVGKFNAHMADALLLRVEEGYWAGDRKAEGVLKNLVTSATLAIERKGVDVGMVRSVMRIIVTSNSDWVVPASFDERRWAVFNVSDSRIGDEEYFAAYSAEMDGDGPAALLHYLQTYPLTDFNVRVAPETEGLLEQKLASLRDFDKWWFDVLRRGALGDDWENGTVRISCDSIADDYNAHAKDDRFHAQHMDGRSIGKALRKVCPAVDRKKGGSRSSRIWQYVIPALSECRREFEKLAKRKIDWSGENG